MGHAVAFGLGNALEILEEGDPTTLLALQAVSDIVVEVENERARNQAQHIVAALAEAMR